jgi:hypothetical protein
MFACLGVIKVLWTEMFPSLYLIGKIVLFPLFAAFTIALAALGLCEIFLFDIWIIIVTLFTKDMTIGDLFDYFVL